MSLFGAISIAQSGLDVSQTWIDTTAGNIANANDVATAASPPYRAEELIAAPAQPGSPVGGVVAAGVALGSATGRSVYEPSSPLANAQGMVVYPAVDMGVELSNLVMAQDSYQANAAVVGKATAAYQAALALGKGL